MAVQLIHPAAQVVSGGIDGGLVPSLPSRPNSTPTAPESSLLCRVASTLPWRIFPGSAAFNTSSEVSILPSRDSVRPRIKSADTL